MERITLYIRTTKTSGKIRLRFRLTDGRDVQLFHKSQIEAELADLKKFNADGKLKPRISVYNEELSEAIDKEITAVREAYIGMKERHEPLLAEAFEAAIDKALNPDKSSSGQRSETLLSRFNKYIDSMREYGTLSEGRVRFCGIVRDGLKRYLKISKKLNCTIDEFTPLDIIAFRDFIINEYKLVEKYPAIYSGLPGRAVPSKKMSANTAVHKLLALKAFYTELEENDEIVKSPFRRLTKKRCSELLHEQTDEPFFLRQDEFLALLNATDIPEKLRETRDAFLLLCALGCRIGDFQRMTMDNVAVSEEGIPYVRYLPNKTMKSQADRREKKTPLMRFAFDIVKRTGFKFDVLRYTAGDSGFNAKIKKLMEHLKIDRLVNDFDEETQTVKRVPLYKLASTKLARKTHVDIANKAQINMYAAGLHTVGSRAVHHYSALEIRDLFTLLCYAFNQPQYRVDKDLNIIEDSGNIERGRDEIAPIEPIFPKNSSLWE